MPSLHAPTPPTGDGTTTVRLHNASIGVAHITMFVIAAAAPLTVVVGTTPLVIGLGAGIGAPGIFVAAGLIYLLFAVGYGAMSRHVGNAGAFYTYITRGLGRPVGVGGALIALLAYNSVQIAVYGAFGYFTAETMQGYFSLPLPWWVYSLLCIAAVHAVGARNINLSGKVLGLLLLLEAGIVLLLDIAIVASPAQRPPLTFSSFLPSEIFGPGFGVSLVFVIACFIGFEATAIFSEEARDPRRTVPRATYCAVTLIGLFYVASCWAIIQFYGAADVVAQANADPANFWLGVSQRLLGPLPTTVLNVLVLTSMFACVLAFHNSVTRYLFSLSREGVIWHGMARLHPREHSPYVASRSQTMLATLAISLGALFSLDPYNVLFAWLAGLASLSILALQALAALSIAGFFHRQPLHYSLWTRKVAPLVSAALLSACFALVTVNLPLLTGTDNLFVMSFPWLVVATGLVGVILAQRMRSRYPQRYADLGMSIEP